MASTIIAIVSDTHVGSSTAIAPPRFTVHSGRAGEKQTTLYNAYQKWLFACWIDYWEYVRSLAGIVGKTRKNRLVIFHLGDAVDGKHHRSVQTMEEIQDQLEAVCNLLRPLANMADGGMYLTYGTGAHNGGCAEMETTIGNELGIHHDWEYSLDVDGLTFDLTHHGRAGRRDWTSSAAGLAVEVATDYISAGVKPPRYVLRGHNHKIDDSGQKLDYIRAISLPSWQLRTAYGHQVAANQRRSDIGGLILDTGDPDNPNFSRMRYQAPGGYIHVTKV
jgi:hypothetical protein